MKSTGSFKRILAALCTAAILMGGGDSTSLECTLEAHCHL